MNRPGLLVLLLAITIAVPWAAVPAAPGALQEERWVVGFYAMPDVRPGDDYQGARVVRADPVLRFVDAATDAPAAFRARVALDDNVRYLEPLQWGREDFTPNDPRFGSQYGPQQIGAPSAWDTTLGSTSIKACYTDSGIRQTHEELTGRLGGFWNFPANNGNPTDDTGHGTHVIGIAAAATHNAKGIAGIAGSTFWVAKTGIDGSHAVTDVAAGWRWCVDTAAAHVVGSSLGFSSASTTLEDAVNYAWNNGLVSASSAGNNGPCSGCVSYPARYVNVMAVACTTSSKALCSFSSQGPEVDLAAPGSSIDSSCNTGDTSYCLKSGTSMSSPHVSGSAALLKAANPTWTNTQIRNALESTAEDLGAAGPDNSFGKGLVRLDLAMGSPPPPPPPPPPQEMHVSAIDGYSSHRSGNKHTLHCDVTIVDTANAPVSGATVSMRFTKTGGSTSTTSGTTGSNGVAATTVNQGSGHGTASCEVTNVTKSGWTYNAAANVITTRSFSVV